MARVLPGPPSSGGGTIRSTVRSGSLPPRPSSGGKALVAALASGSEEAVWKSFTPTSISTDCCLARTWNEGNGGQCPRAQGTDSSFCFQHARRLPHGRVDRPLPEEMLAKFRKVAPSSCTEKRDRLWLPHSANGAKAPISRSPDPPTQALGSTGALTGRLSHRATATKVAETLVAGDTIRLEDPIECAPTPAVGSRAVPGKSPAPPHGGHSTCKPSSTQCWLLQTKTKLAKKLAEEGPASGVKQKKDHDGVEELGLIRDSAREVFPDVEGARTTEVGRMVIQVGLISPPMKWSNEVLSEQVKSIADELRGVGVRIAGVEELATVIRDSVRELPDVEAARTTEVGVDATAPCRMVVPVGMKAPPMKWPNAVYKARKGKPYAWEISYNRWKNGELIKAIAMSQPSGKAIMPWTVVGHVLTAFTFGLPVDLSKLIEQGIGEPPCQSERDKIEEAAATRNGDPDASDFARKQVLVGILGDAVEREHAMKTEEERQLEAKWYRLIDFWVVLKRVRFEVAFEEPGAKKQKC